MIAALAFALSLHLGEEHPGADRWFAADKAKHFFLSAFIQSASYSAFRTVRLHDGAALVGASVVTFSFGVGKELSDARHGGSASLRDLTWDVAGLAAAGALLHRTAR